MTTKVNAPHVFISYSWKPIQNKLKVISLAERLASNGVHVILDDWDLKEGQDKYSFMEQMVNNPDVKRVLLICNKDYAEKANAKKGGVGVESLVVSGDIYDKADQTKFVPVIFEFDENGNAYTPTFVNSRIFIDLSNDEVFEDNYEVLLRNIFDKPSSRRPPIGQMPSYLDEDDNVYLPTAHKVKTIKNSLINEKRNSPILIQDYLDSYIESINLYILKDGDLDSTNFDELISKNIEDFAVLRDDFLEFLQVYLKYSLEIDSDLILRFFEKFLGVLYSLDSHYPTKSIGYLKSDGFRFFSYELFVHVTALLVEMEKFDLLAQLVYNSYIVEYNDGREVLELSFVEFRQPVQYLNEFKNQVPSRRVSVTADTIKRRAGADSNFVKLSSADLLLYYLSLFKNDDDIWFPETTCYRSFSRRMFPRSKSKRYFEKLKVLFNVDTKEELVLRVKAIYEKGTGIIRDGYFFVPKIDAGLKVSEMATID